MKIFIRGAVDDETVRGYLPLCQEPGGECLAIAAHPLPTAEEADALCVARIRDEVRGLKADIREAMDHFHERQCWIENNLNRLYEGPRSHEPVMVGDEQCAVAGDGSARMPAVRQEQAEELAMPGIPGGVVVDDELIAVLRRAAGEEGLSRERVLEMIGDMVRDEPADFLLAVAETAWEQIGRAAELLVMVCQARGERSVWAREREERERARAAEDG